MPRMMTPGETNYRLANRQLGERRYEFDTGTEADFMKQAAALEAQRQMAEQAADAKKWTDVIGGITSLGAIPLGRALAPSAVGALDEKADWIMKNPDKAKRLGY